MDVTGHGLASALTVSRLSGEIERLLAEDPDISPGAVLRALNRYVSLTLAKHSVYLTAIAVQVDPADGTVRYVNAGHPPAFVRRADGRVERFDSTTFLLGAVPDADFDADETEIVLGPADTLVLVTDGVHEAPDRMGRQFGLDRLREHLARPSAPDRWSLSLAQAVEQWRGRIGDDDVLVATRFDGAPLPKEHGGPARVIIPKLYAWKGSKFVSGITFLTEDKLGFWEVRGYSNTADPWTEDRYA